MESAGLRRRNMQQKSTAMGDTRGAEEREGEGKRAAKIDSGFTYLIILLLVTLAWVFFRAENFDHAATWFVSLSGFRGLGTFPLWGLGVLAAMAFAILAPNAYTFDAKKVRRGHWLVLGLIFGVTMVLMNYSSTFIYYQF